MKLNTLTLIAISLSTAYSAPIDTNAPAEKRQDAQRIGLEVGAAVGQQITKGLDTFRDVSKTKRQLSNEILGTAIGESVGKEIGDQLQRFGGGQQKEKKRQDGQRVGLEVGAALGQQITKGLDTFRDVNKEKRQIAGIVEAARQKVGEQGGAAQKRQLSNEIIGTAIGDAVGNRVGDALQRVGGQKE